MLSVHEFIYFVFARYKRAKEAFGVYRELARRDGFKEYRTKIGVLFVDQEQMSLTDQEKQVTLQKKLVQIRFTCT